MRLSAMLEHGVYTTKHSELKRWKQTDKAREVYIGKLERLLKEIYWHTEDADIDSAIHKLLSERPGS